MIRRVLVAMTLVVGALGALPQANALAPKVYRGAFKGPASGGTVPCGMVCAYWIDDPACGFVEEACTEGGLLHTGYDVCRDPGPGYSHLPGSADEVPEPAGSNQPRAYQDIKIKAPAGYNFAEFRIYPTADWDSFICEGTATSNNGRLLTSGAHSVLAPCDGITGPDDPSGFGCAELTRIRVTPGKYYVFRAYNWSDLTDCPYEIKFKYIA